MMAETRTKKRTRKRILPGTLLIPILTPETMSYHRETRTKKRTRKRILPGSLMIPILTSEIMSYHRGTPIFRLGQPCRWVL
jgi:hypothetical protein